MIITLPDGSEKTFEADSINGLDVAKSISNKLRKKAVAVEVDGVEQDLCIPIADGATVRVLTTQDPQGLDVMRHTLTAQVLARAIQEEFPGSKLAIGPTIEHGFYYDVESSTPISVDDLPRIESRMHKILGEHSSITRIATPRDEAIQLFAGREEPYKVEIMEGTEGQESFPLYHQGESGFVDLCRGPHVQDTKSLRFFKRIHFKNVGLVQGVAVGQSNRFLRLFCGLELDERDA